MPDASPAKWHLAHTTWFFETFVLRDVVPRYRPFDERFPFLFNSYYEAKGARIGRTARGLLTRPSLDEIRDYRRYVDVKRTLNPDWSAGWLSPDCLAALSATDQCSCESAARITAG